MQHTIVERRFVAELTDQEDRLRGLTPRELAVLALLCRGASYDEICNELSMARRTVSYYTSAIYEKLGLANRPRTARQRELGKFCLALDSIEGRFKLMDYYVIPYNSEGNIITADSIQGVNGLEVRITLNRPYGAVKDVIDRALGALGPYMRLVPIKDQPSDRWFELRTVYSADSKGTFLAVVKLFDAPDSTEILIENRDSGIWLGSSKGSVVGLTKSLCEALVLRGYTTQPQGARILIELEQYSR